MTDPHIEILPERTALAATDRRARFVLRISPPAAPVRDRPPIRLVLALDTSGSMAGEPLASAVLTARGVARSLTSRDEFGIVAFADIPTVVAPMQRMTPAGIAAVEGLVSQARAGGNTDLAGAILKALELIDADKSEGHVLLLTDGRPTFGVTSSPDIVRLAQARIGRSTLSTFGFGRGVDAELLSNIADAGRGHYAFIEAGEAPVEAIGAELGGLLDTVAVSVEVEIEAAKGVTIEAVGRAAGHATITSERAHLHLAPLVADEPVFVAFTLGWGAAQQSPVRATVRLRANSAIDGHAIQKAAEVVPAFAEATGPKVKEAAHALFLSDVADLLASPPEATDDPARILAGLRKEASEGGIADDPQIAAALQMVSRMFDTASDARSRQDRVAAMRAVYTRKETMTGVSGYESSRVFAAKSQIAGAERLKHSIAPNPGATPPPGPPADGDPAESASPKEVRRVGAHTLLGIIFGRNKRPIGQG